VAKIRETVDVKINLNFEPGEGVLSPLTRAEFKRVAEEMLERLHEPIRAFKKKEPSIGQVIYGKRNQMKNDDVIFSTSYNLETGETTTYETVTLENRDDPDAAPLEEWEFGLIPASSDLTNWHTLASMNLPVCESKVHDHELRDGLWRRPITEKQETVEPEYTGELIPEGYRKVKWNEPLDNDDCLFGDAKRNTPENGIPRESLSAHFATVAEIAKDSPKSPIGWGEMCYIRKLQVADIPQENLQGRPEKESGKEGRCGSWKSGSRCEYNDTHSGNCFFGVTSLQPTLPPGVPNTRINRVLAGIEEDKGAGIENCGWEFSIGYGGRPEIASNLTGPNLMSGGYSSSPVLTTSIDIQGPEDWE